MEPTHDGYLDHPHVGTGGLHQVGPISIPVMASRLDGRDLTGVGIPTCCRHGQSRNLSAALILARISRQYALARITPVLRSDHRSDGRRIGSAALRPEGTAGY